MNFDLQGAINADTVGRVTIPGNADLQDIGAVTIPKPMIVEGNGPWTTKLRGTITAPDGTGVILQNFRLESSVAGETGITMGTEAVSVKPKLSNLVLANFDTPLDIQGACAAQIENVYFVDYTLKGMKLANKFNGDQGDNKVVDCEFSTSIPTAEAGIFQTSSGGLTISGNKFLGGQRAYDGQFDCETSDLTFTGNSFENLTEGAVRVLPAEGCRFANFTMSPNQMAGAFNGVDLTNVDNVAMTANIFNLPPGHTAMKLRGCTCLHILNNPIPSGVTALDNQ